MQRMHIKIGPKRFCMHSNYICYVSSSLSHSLLSLLLQHSLLTFTGEFRKSGSLISYRYRNRITIIITRADKDNGGSECSEIPFYNILLPYFTNNQQERIL